MECYDGHKFRQARMNCNLSLSLCFLTPQNASDPAAIDKLMGTLDENNDGELTFLEFWQLIGTLASQHGGF